MCWHLLVSRCRCRWTSYRSASPAALLLRSYMFASVVDPRACSVTREYTVTSPGYSALQGWGARPLAAGRWHQRWHQKPHMRACTCRAPHPTGALPPLAHHATAHPPRPPVPGAYFQVYGNGNVVGKPGEIIPGGQRPDGSCFVRAPAQRCTLNMHHTPNIQWVVSSRDVWYTVRCVNGCCFLPAAHAARDHRMMWHGAPPAAEHQQPPAAPAVPCRILPSCGS